MSDDRSFRSVELAHGLGGSIAHLSVAPPSSSEPAATAKQERRLDGGSAQIAACAGRDLELPEDLRMHVEGLVIGFPEEKLRSPEMFGPPVETPAGAGPTAHAWPLWGGRVARSRGGPSWLGERGPARD